MSMNQPSSEIKHKPCVSTVIFFTVLLCTMMVCEAQDSRTGITNDREEIQVAQERKVKVDYSTIPAAEKFAKIKNPQSIREFLVNNMLDAADEITHSEYNGTNGQKTSLIDALMTQAFFIKMNDGSAFFPDSTNGVFENALKSKGEAALNLINTTLVDRLIAERLPDAEGVPTDPAVAAEFTSIVKIAFHQAVETRRVQLGIAKTEPVAVTEVESNTAGRDVGLVDRGNESNQSSGEQDGTVQPATRPESESKGSDKPQPEAEGRSR